MRKTLRALVAIVSILVAILAIFSFFYRLGDMRTSGERSSGAEYSILRNALMPLQSRGDLQDSAFRDRLLALYKGSDRLLAAQVLDSSGLTAWKLPSGSAYFALPNDSSVRGGFSAPEGSTVIFTTPLGDGMRLSALYVTLKRSDISEAAKLPVIIIALWCLVVALSILLLGEEAKARALEKAPGQPEAEIPPTPEPAPYIEDEAAMEPEAESAPEPEPLQDSAVSPDDMASTEDLASPEDLITVEDLTKREDLAEKDDVAAVEPMILRSGRSFEESLAKLEEDIIDWSSRYPGQEPRPTRATTEKDQRLGDDLDEELGEELDELETAPEDDPEENEESALADSRETLQEFEELNAEAIPEKPADTGDEKLERAVESSASPAQERKDLADLPMPLALGDSLLEARLSEELARGPRTEVSLMLIHCGISSRTDPAAVALAVTVKDYIGSRELIFELYKGAFAVVLPSVDLGGALKMSEDLADVLSATLSLYKDIEGEAPVFIGISASSGRKVDAYKIYREASTAVHKAYSGSQSRILAFRPKTE